MKQKKLFYDAKEYTLNNEQELKYFGSTLNKFANKECRGSDYMVVNNIDLVICDYKNKNEIRIIESKHVNEKPMSDGQRIILETLSRMGIKCYLVIASPPYETARVYSFQSKKNRILNKKQLIKFLENDY